MTKRRRRRVTRGQRTFRALLVTVLGTVIVAGLAAWVSARRDTDRGDPTAGLSSDFRGAAPADDPLIRFTDVAAEMGITARHAPGPRSRILPEDMGSGAAWGDVEGDGDPDLFLVGYPATDGNPDSGQRLYRNDRTGFADVTEEAGLADPNIRGMGATFADYDDDGDLDLYVTAFGPNRLFRNDGSGRFVDVADTAGVDDAQWSTGAAWGDVDADGHLDLYVTNYVRYDDVGLDDLSPSSASSEDMGVPFTLNPNSFDPVPNRLYRNRGDGTFEEIASRAGVDDPDGRGLAATLCDLDGDGAPDIYVNNDVSTNRLFRNLAELPDAEGPRFHDLSTLTGTADPRGSMGLSVADVGGADGMPDGLPDLFITHWVAQENALYESAPTESRGLEYRDRTRDRGLGEISIDRVGWGSSFVDIDLDGRLDLIVANGSTLEEEGDVHVLRDEAPFVLWNDGRRWVDVATSAGDATSAKHGGRGLAAADYDRDGDVDLLMTVNRAPPLLLRNDTTLSHHGLAVVLEAPEAISWGARIQVETAAGLQTRWWGADASYLSGHERRPLFGLGAAPTVLSLRVRWRDGTETVLHDVPAGEVRVQHQGS